MISCDCWECPCARIANDKDAEGLPICDECAMGNHIENDEDDDAETGGEA